MSKDFGQKLPAIVIGCDYGLAFDFALDTSTDLTGYTVEGDITVLTDTGVAASPAVTGVMAWAAGGAAAGVAQLTLTAAQTAGLSPGRVITRPVLVRTADAVRIPVEALVLRVEAALEA